MLHIHIKPEIQLSNHQLIFINDNSVWVIGCNIVKYLWFCCSSRVPWVFHTEFVLPIAIACIWEETSSHWYQRQPDLVLACRLVFNMEVYLFVQNSKMDAFFLQPGIDFCHNVITFWLNCFARSTIRWHTCWISLIQVQKVIWTLWNFPFKISVINLCYLTIFSSLKVKLRIFCTIQIDIFILWSKLFFEFTF